MKRFWMLLPMLVLVACEHGVVPGSEHRGHEEHATVEEPEPEEPELGSPLYGPCADKACIEDPTIIGFTYQTELLIAISKDKGWPACPVDLDDYGQREKFRQLYSWLVTHVARVPGYVTMSHIDALMEDLECLWVGWSELVTVYNSEPKVDGGGATAFWMPSSPDPVSGVLWEFSFVQIWNHRFNGEWWPLSFLCLVDMPGVLPDRIPPRSCTRSPS